MRLSDAELDEMNRYVQKHGTWPPIDHPTMGEFSDWGRSGGRNLFLAFVCILILVIGALAIILGMIGAIDLAMRLLS